MLDLQGKYFLGYVVNNLDPERRGRCRVKVINIFDDIPDDIGPWASPRKDLNGNVFNLPEVGKIVGIVFNGGNIYTPEYIYSEHHHENLETKLKDLDDKDYTSMKSLLFDHKTQIYVNDSEGLNIEYKFHAINIDDSSINLNLKENQGNLNLGDANAEQQAILGNHFFNWFDELLDMLEKNPYFGNMGGPVVISPPLLTIFQKYRMLRDKKFLSHHVRIIDNSNITTQADKAESFPVHRVNFGLAGDRWKLNGILNKYFRKLPNIPLPRKKKKKKFDARYKSPQKKRPLPDEVEGRGHYVLVC